MSIATVRAALADACATVSGLRGAAYEVDQVNPPQAVVGTVQFDPRMAMGQTKCEREILVRVYVGRTAETAAQKLLDTYSELSGSSSLVAAIQDNAALRALVDEVEVVRVRGPLTDTVGDVGYIVLELDVVAVF